MTSFPEKGQIIYEDKRKVAFLLVIDDWERLLNDKSGAKNMPPVFLEFEFSVEKFLQSIAKVKILSRCHYLRSREETGGEEVKKQRKLKLFENFR